jgi:hypothetical protein
MNRLPKQRKNGNQNNFKYMVGANLTFGGK